MLRRLFFALLLASCVATLAQGQARKFNLRFIGAYGFNGCVEQPVRKVACSGHNAALLQDSTIVIWGNGAGYLENPPNARHFVSVASAGGYSAGLRVDGSVGMFVAKIDSQACTPPANVGRLREIAGGPVRFIGLRSDSTVVVWGPEAFRFQPPANLRKVVAVAGGVLFCLALRVDGTVTGWGDTTGGALRIPQGLSNVVAIAAGTYSGLALKADGHVVRWGGRFRDGPFNYSIPDSVANIKAIAEGDSFSLAVKTNGELRMYSRMPSQSRRLLDHLPSNNIKSIQAQVGHVIALMNDSTVRCADYYDTDMGMGPPKGFYDLRSVALTSESVFGVRADGRLAIWPEYGDRRQMRDPAYMSRIEKLAVDRTWISPVVIGIRNDATLQIGGSNISTFPSNPSPVKEVVTAVRGTIALLENGTLTALGQGFNTPPSWTIPPGLGRVRAISAGKDHIMALLEDSSVVVWGDNTYHQLDIPSFLRRDVVAISAGRSHCLALRANGTVVAWGENTSDECMVPPGLNNVVKIAATGQWNVAIKADGTPVFWGRPPFPLPTPQLRPDLRNVKDLQIHLYWGVALMDSNYTQPRQMLGTVFRNVNGDCLQDSTELGIPDATVVAQPGNYFASTDLRGRFSINAPAGQYQVRQVLDYDDRLLLRPICPVANAPQAADLSGNRTTAGGLNFADEWSGCPYMTVAVSGIGHRRCRSTSVLINYSNQGYSVQNGVQVHIQMPSIAILQGANKPYTVAPDGSLIFEIGSVPAHTSGSIIIYDSIPCITGITGTDLCVRAWLTPGIQTCQFPANYDRSIIDIVGACIRQPGDSVSERRFTIRNRGGAMATARPFRVYVDQYYVYENSYLLGAGDSLVVQYRPWDRTEDSAVFRLEAVQDTLSPYGSYVAANLDCISGSGHRVRPSDMRPTSDSPIEAANCETITDSYDPNDKQVYPRGWEAAGNVEPDTRLTYRIRFMNKGTDTALVVKVVDTLDAALDLSTLRYGPASHPYTVSISGKGRPVLTWTFRAIHLLDSARYGAARASGFSSFSIKPKATAPLGTIVRNAADIYFDMNDPVRTNATLNTLYKPARTDSLIRPVVVTHANSRIGKPFSVEPNPGTGRLNLTSQESGILQVYAPDGALVSFRIHPGTQTIDISTLAPTLYCLRLNGRTIRYVKQ